jgi:hypothetical protein
VKLRLESGEDAAGLGFDGTLLTMRSPRAFAPGSPIRFTTTTEAGKRSFEGRVIGSKRADDERFEVRMRFVNLRREDRALLTERLRN